MRLQEMQQKSSKQHATHSYNCSVILKKHNNRGRTQSNIRTYVKCFLKQSYVRKCVCVFLLFFFAIWRYIPIPTDKFTLLTKSISVKHFTTVN